MDSPIVKAGIDLGTLIYIIVMLLWVFGKLFSNKNKQKGNKPPVHRRPAESTAEAELREFLERMSGQQEVEEEEEEEEEIVEAPQPQLRRQPIHPVRQNLTQATSHHATPTETPPSACYVRGPEHLSDASEVMAANKHMHLGVGTAAAFASALRSTGSQFKLTEANISILKQSMRSSHPVPLHPVISRNELKSKRMLKKALAAQVILGTPRAFETSDVPEAIRH